MTTGRNNNHLARAVPSRAITGTLMPVRAVEPVPEEPVPVDVTPPPGAPPILLPPPRGWRPRLRAVAARGFHLIRPLAAPFVRPFLARLERRMARGAATAIAEARLADEIAASEHRLAARLSAIEAKLATLASADEVQALRQDLALRAASRARHAGPDGTT